MDKHPPDTGRKLDKVEADDIELGMYMAYADRPWLETKFLFQGFLLDREDLVNQVKLECQFIYVDPVKSYHADEIKKRQPGGDRKQSEIMPTDREFLKSADPQRYRIRRPVEDVLDSAYRAHQDSLQSIKEALKTVKTGAGINVSRVRETVKSCVKNIADNPNALLWLSRMRHRDEYTAEHCLNVGILAIAMGRHLGLDQQALEALGLCGMLHDVGKMHVDQEVLNKPGHLSEHEFTHIKTHCDLGKQELTKDPNLPKVTVEAAWGHHERIDGRGYPRGISSGKLHLFTRIVSIVDTYDAITTNRCYDNSRPATEAIKILFTCRNSQFDGWLVEQFIACLGIYPIGSLVELHSGEGAVVIDSESDKRLFPKVTVVLDENKRTRPLLMVDTSLHRDRTDGRTIKAVLDENDYTLDLASVFTSLRTGQL